MLVADSIHKLIKEYPSFAPLLQKKELRRI